MEIRYYLRMLAKGWWVILLTTLIALDVALVSSYMMTPIYRSSARFIVSPSVTAMTDGRDLVYSTEVLDKRSIVTTYAEMLNSVSIYEEALQDLNFTLADVAGYTHSVVVIPDSNILELSVEGPDPNRAAAIANTLGQRAIKTIKQVYQAYDILLLDKAVPTAVPIRPVPLRDAGLAAVLGLVVGSGLALLREQVRITMESYRHRLDTDRVSAAFNHGYIKRQLELERDQNPKGELSFGLVRLDGLQGLIDTLPQSLVQELLRRVTSTLRKELRGNDLVGRWDEITFAVLLPTTPSAAANRTIQRICSTINQPINLELYGEVVELQPRASVATSLSDETAPEIIQRAEEELDKARSMGLNSPNAERPGSQPGKFAA